NPGALGPRPSELRESYLFIRVIVGVDLGVLVPFRRELVLGEAGVHRTGLDAGIAVDAFIRVDVEHLDRFVVGLVRRRMDAVDRTNLDTGIVLGADARLCNDVGHVVTLPSVFPVAFPAALSEGPELHILANPRAVAKYARFLT